jgi:hypothetical protein
MYSIEDKGGGKAMKEKDCRLIQEKLLDEEWIDHADATSGDCKRENPHYGNQQSNRTFKDPDDLMAVVNKLVEKKKWKEFLDFCHKKYLEKR